MQPKNNKWAHMYIYIYIYICLCRSVRAIPRHVHAALSGEQKPSQVHKRPPERFEFNVSMLCALNKKTESPSTTVSSCCNSNIMLSRGGERREEERRGEEINVIHSAYVQQFSNYFANQTWYITYGLCSPEQADCIFA